MRVVLYAMRKTDVHDFKFKHIIRSLLNNPELRGESHKRVGANTLGVDVSKRFSITEKSSL
jgi:hypothetical protein